MSAGRTGNENDEAISREWLEFHFGSLRPSLAYLPHCVFRTAKEALSSVLQVVNAKGGVLGEAIYWDREERIYLGCVDETPEDFSLWAVAKNQHEVLRSAAYGKLAQFTAVVDARCPPELIREMYSTAQSARANFSWYNWWIENIARWVPRLGWVYIPLMFEDTPFDKPFAIFVTGPDGEVLVENVRSELRAKGIDSFELTLPGDSGPDEEKGT